MPIPTWFLVVITIGVIVMALAMLVQLGLLLALFLSVRSLQRKVQDLLDNQLQPILDSAKSIMDKAEQQASQLVEALSEITATARSQVVKLDQVLGEATDRARLTIIRVDEVMADTLARFDSTVDYIQRSVVRPVQELQAIIHGVARAFGFILRQRKGPEGVTQDEELFI
jgi:methyl-accepting chemotaxis protein